MIRTKRFGKTKAVKMGAVALGAVLCATTMIPIAANAVYAEDASGVNKYYSAYSSWQDVENAASVVNEELMEESIVMLKNRKNTLPLKNTDMNVTLFGTGSVNPTYGSNGSGTRSINAYTEQVTLINGLKHAGFNINPATIPVYEGLGNTTNHSTVGDGANVPAAQVQSTFDKFKTSYSTYDDAAVVVITRTGGEGLDYSMTRYYDGTNQSNSAGEGNGRGDWSADAETVKESNKAGNTANRTIHTLRLNKDEQALMDYVTAAGFKNVVVLVNSPIAMELGELEDNDAVGGVLWVGQPGVNGFEAVGKVLNGEVSPSGRTVEVFASRYDQDPTWYNFGDQAQTNAEHKMGVDSVIYDKDGNVVTFTVGSGVGGGAGGKSSVYSVAYEEGIYTSYRWYETQSADNVANEYYKAAESNGAPATGFVAATGETFTARDGANPYMPNNDGATYDVNDTYYNRYNGVVYPFGYGLSYTTFDWSIDNKSALDDLALTANGKVTINVTVKNTGKYAGRDVVQVYYDPDYNGTIEKAAANLVQFEKTDILQPGESQMLAIEFDVKDMASFDDIDANKNGFAGYELEKGDYKISLRTDSHNIKKSSTNVDLQFTAKVNGAEAGYTSAWVSGNGVDQDYTGIVYDGRDLAHNYNGKDADGNENANAEPIFSETDKASSDWLYNTRGDENVIKYVSRSAESGLALPDAPAKDTNKYGDDWVTRIKAFEGYTAVDDLEDLYKNQEYIATTLPETWTQSDYDPQNKIMLSSLSGIGYPVWKNENGTVTAANEAARKYDEFLNQLSWEQITTIHNTDNSSIAYSLEPDGSVSAGSAFPGGMPGIPGGDGPAPMTAKAKNSARAATTGKAPENLAELGVKNARSNDGANQLQAKGKDTAAEGSVGIFPASETNVATTWGKEIAAKRGTILGEESLWMNVTGLWGSGMNLKRSPFQGRNFEYLSADGVQGGLIAAAMYGAAEEMGMVVYIKHYILNEQDTYRNDADGCAVWLTEQSLRELYGKTYEITIKQGNAHGIMTAFMRMGGISQDNNYNLLYKLTRGEWGFHGEMCTDAGAGASGEACLRAGCDTPLMNFGGAKSSDHKEWSAADNLPVVEGDNTDKQIAKTEYYNSRITAARVMYTVANSNAMQNGLVLASFAGKDDLKAFANSNSYVGVTITEGWTTTTIAKAIGGIDIDLSADKDKIGTDDVTYALASGSVLPEGLIITSDGRLSGTTSEAGTFKFKVRIYADKYVSCSKEFTVVISKPISYSAVKGTAGDEDFESQISLANGITGSASYTVTGLPEGMEFDSETGLIFGAPTEAGKYDVSVSVKIAGADEYTYDTYTDTVTLEFSDAASTDKYVTGTAIVDGKLVEYYSDGSSKTIGNIGANEAVVPETNEDNGLAVAALVLSVLGVCGIGALTAVTFIGKKKEKSE